MGLAPSYDQIMVTGVIESDQYLEGETK